MAFEDKTLVCRDCSSEFLFTAGEQEFYESRGLQNEPGRCASCRSARRRDRGFDDRGPRQMYSAVCASCGGEAEVPFEPRPERPVYCNACFGSMKRPL